MESIHTYNKLKILLTLLLLFGIYESTKIDHPIQADAYFYLRNAEHIRDTGTHIHFDTHSSYPGRPFSYPTLYHYIIYWIGKITGTTTAWKILPTICLTATTYLNYKIGETCFNKKTGYIAAIITPTIPYNIQQIYNPDITMFVTMCLAVTSYLLIKAMQDKTFIKSLEYNLSYGLFLTAWHGALIYLTLFTGWFIGVLIKTNKKALFTLLTIIIIPAITLPELTFGCWQEEVTFCYLDRLPHLPYGEELLYKLSDHGLITEYEASWEFDTDFQIRENQPPNLQTIYEFTYIYIIGGIIGAITLLKNKKIWNEGNLFLISWMIVMGLTYTTQYGKGIQAILIPITILSAFTYNTHIKNMNKKTQITLSIILILIPTHMFITFHQDLEYLTIDPDRVKGLEWIRENAQNKVFLNHWSMGHYISYYGGINAIDGLHYHGGDRNIPYRKHFLNKIWVTNEETTWHNLKNNGYEYIWIDQYHLFYADEIISITTNNTITKAYQIKGNKIRADTIMQNSFLTQALIDPTQLKHFTIAYQNPKVTILKTK